MENRVLLSGLAVTDNTVATSLVTNIVGSGVSMVSNQSLVAYTGTVSTKYDDPTDSSSAGTFTGGNLGSPVILGFDSGIVLSTGGVQNVIGPNEFDQISQENSLSGDSDLSTLVGVPTFDATVLEFDFTPVGSTVSFNYVFSSDEYNEFVNPLAPYRDVFGVFVNHSSTNVAVVPTNLPITVNNINNSVNSGDFRDNELPLLGGPAPICIEMDGLTVVLTVTANVNPGVANHIKLAIADGADPNYDSNVFIQAASFMSPPDQGGDPTIDSLSANSVFEDGIVHLTGTYSNIPPTANAQLTINWGEGAPQVVNVTGGSFDIPHQYLDDNPTNTPFDVYMIGVTLSDGLGGSDTDSTTTTVTNVAPVINSLAATSVFENGVVHMTGTYSDFGTQDTHTLTINWGEGVPQTVTVTGGSFDITHQYLDDNPSGTASDVYIIGVRLTDDDTGFVTASTTTRITNVAPVINTLAATSVFENGVVRLTGTYSDVGTQDTHKLTINWGEGAPQIVTVTGGSFDITHQYLDDNPTCTSSDVYTIGVRLTDDDTGFVTRSTTTRITNVAPVLTSLTNSSPDCGQAFMGVDRVTISAAFSDVGKRDTHSASINWGDGTTSTGTVTETIGTGIGTVSGSHVYATGGFFTITVTLKDDDTSISQLQTIATVGGIGVRNGQLQIIGTNGRDIVEVTLVSSNGGSHCGSNGGSSSKISVKTQFNLSCRGGAKTYTFDASTITSIRILGCGCDDDLKVSSNIKIPTTIDGGAGNDRIWGGGGNDTIVDLSGNNQIWGGNGNDVITTGSGNDNIDAGAGNDIVYAGAGNDCVLGGDGNDIIVGGAGNDTIDGGKGRDFLIGGTGADNIKGGDDDDILIADYTSYDSNQAALSALFKEWTSCGSYASRVSNLRTGGGLTGGFKLIGDHGATQTVFNDNDVDRLDGNCGLDVFWANLVADNGGALDIVMSSCGETKLDTDF